MPHFMTWVLQALTKYPTRTLFKEFDHSQSFPSWLSVSYESFLHDLERSAAYWDQALSVHGLNQNDVARAGFIPEVLTPNATLPIIRDLFAKIGDKALISEPDFVRPDTDIGCSTLTIPDLGTLPAPSLPLAPLSDVAPTDIALIFHTSGTTSDVPKPLRAFHCYPDGRPLVINNIGFFANVGSAIDINQLFIVVRSLSDPDLEIRFRGGGAPGDDQRGRERLVLVFAVVLETVEHSAEQPPQFCLKAMGQINCTGAALNREDEIWATEQGIAVTVNEIRFN
ncbi:hypothetical protein B0H14DRAFT_3483762 [Mycena olivaceomarginata]|nr:hypothetical protein B0H14DRAFT_3483762 [Mycena olivaceomarginata]